VISRKETFGTKILLAANRHSCGARRNGIMDSERLLIWIAFNVFVLGMLALDLGVFHRKAHAVSIKEASIWSVVWIVLALLFNTGIYFFWGLEKALEFLTGYVVEKSLSVDNLFVFLMIFQYFATPAQYQHRVLFWGILGALILRALFIAAGSALLDNFHWMIYIFGGFLVLTGIKMALQGDEKLAPEKNPVVRLFQRWIPVSQSYHGQSFFVRKEGKLHATLLMLVLIVVETTDVIFAVDSIPAIFAITRDPFIVYTSNVFAILGLRALYFMLAGVMEMFAYLKVGLSVILCFVGVKMLLVDIYKVPIGMSLAVIGGVLLLSILASWLKQKATPSDRPSQFDRKLARPRRIFASPRACATSSVTFCAAIVLLVVVLALVKWHAVARGPTGNEAIALLRVVERELAAAQEQQPINDQAIVDRANDSLDEAWSKFEERRYREAILSAQAADRMLAERSK
jgi:tellurite resistance protein TerC